MEKNFFMRRGFKYNIDWFDGRYVDTSCASLLVIWIAISIHNYYADIFITIVTVNELNSVQTRESCTVCIRTINFSFLNLYDRRSGNIALCFDLRAALTSRQLRTNVSARNYITRLIHHVFDEFL